tara:strand:+ start:4858 stop:5484 length:627 start_codon:yes stop_codon:yes gene_type:complete
MSRYNPSIQELQGGSRKGKKLYEDWHWGIGPSRFIDWDDPDYPETLIECGRLVRIHFRAPRVVGTHPRREKDRMIEFSRSIANNSHLAYDPEHPDQRLYLLLCPEASPTVAERFWDNNSLPSQPLSQLATLAGGRHGKRPDYPRVMVKPVGIMTAVVYYTHKKDDGPSYYIHKLGEESCHYPILAVGSLGRLWMAGGHYRAPVEGVTD